jgi:hypothetical protein
MNLPSDDFKILTYANESDATYLHHEDPAPLLPREPIILETESTWTHVGAPLDVAALPPSFHTWSRGTFRTGNILPLLIPFLTFLHKFMEDTHMTHYCLSIRAQKPTHDFDIPRWHVDRRFFDADVPDSQVPSKIRKEAQERKSSNWKLATALVGPGTLFLKDGKKGRCIQRAIEKRLKLSQSKKGHYAVDATHVCTSFRCLGCADIAEAVRQELVKELAGMETVQVGRGEVAVFKVDGYNACDGEPAMHSEPNLSGGDRVFVHVVPGREEELRRLVDGWGMEFPRDWCLGVLQELVVGL